LTRFLFYENPFFILIVINDSISVLHKFLPVPTREGVIYSGLGEASFHLDPFSTNAQLSSANLMRIDVYPLLGYHLGYKHNRLVLIIKEVKK